MDDERVALFFVPANEGDHLIGLPARDLTESEVEDFKVREPWLLRDATTPNHVTGKAMYQKTKPTGKRAEVIEHNKEVAAVSPPVAPVETPVKERA